MRRRDLLKAAGAGLTAIAAPRIGRAERPNKLVFASSGGSAPSCKCNYGRTYRTFRWANIGSPPPIERICWTYCPAASMFSMGSAEVKISMTSSKNFGFGGQVSGIKPGRKSAHGLSVSTLRPVATVSCQFLATLRSGRPASHQQSRSRQVLPTAGMGQEEPFQPRGLSG